MCIKDSREVDLNSITGVDNMEDDTMKTNQNGVMKIAEDEATECINGQKIKRSKKLTENWLQYKLEQLKTNRRSMLSWLGGPVW